MKLCLCVTVQVDKCMQGHGVVMTCAIISGGVKSHCTINSITPTIRYVALQFFIFQQTVQIASNFLHSNAHIFLFGLILRDIQNSITPQTNSGRTARTPLYPPVQAVPPYSCPLFYSCPGEGQYLCPLQACATTACSKCTHSLHIRSAGFYPYITTIWMNSYFGTRHTSGHIIHRKVQQTTFSKTYMYNVAKG